MAPSDSVHSVDRGQCHRNAVWVLNSGSFPSRSTQPHPLHITAWCSIWGGQILGEVCHRGSPHPSWQQDHLNSCSHSALAPCPFHSILHPRARAGINTEEKGTGPWIASGQNQGCLRASVPEQASLASVVIFFRK